MFIHEDFLLPANLDEEDARDILRLLFIRLSRYCSFPSGAGALH